MSILIYVQDNIEIHNKMWYDAAVQLATKIDVTPHVTRLTGRQTQRNNVPALN